jgi:putative transposase
MAYSIYMKDARFKSNYNVVFECRYHVVFCPKRRKKVLVGNIADRFKELVKTACQKMNNQYVFVKTYTENEWVLDLLKRGFFEDTGQKIESGFCSYPLWKVLF